MELNFCLRDYDDLARLVLGDKLGEGKYREVYECRLRPDKWVVKREKLPGEFMNVDEWKVWQNIQGTKLEKWVAPVDWISEDGFWLIQQRAEPITEDRLPKKVPAFFEDLHKHNWGWLDGRPVCFDYSIYHSFLEYKLVKANWHEKYFRA